MMLRFVVAIPLSILLAVVLFLLMAWLVSSPHQNQPPELNLTAVNFVVDESEATPSRRSRVLPPEPQWEPMPLEHAITAQPTAQLKTVFIAPSEFAVSALNIEVAAMSIQVPEIGSFESSAPITPLHRVEPTFPAKAIQRNIEGHVVIQFNIDDQGRPVDLKVLEAQPKRVFEREAKRALKQWRYQPKIENGKPSMHVGQTVKLEFRQP